MARAGFGYSPSTTDLPQRSTQEREPETEEMRRSCQSRQWDGPSRHERLMNIQSQRNTQVKNVKTLPIKLKDAWLLKLIHQHVLCRVFHRLNRTALDAHLVIPTETQRNLVLTGLMLGFISLFTAIFPVCGLPIAVTGLLIGFYGRRTTSLHTMSSWAFALSLVGLILSFIYTIITISIYFSSYLF